jgi:hypothetical protein
MTSEANSTEVSSDLAEANRYIASALLAAGIGCLVMGIVTTLSEALKPVADLLNLYKPTGPLSGKSLVAIIVWLAAWALLSRVSKGKQINTSKWIGCAMICVALGFITTFPLFFDMFGEK